jgi:hypothetical protein
MKKVFTNSRDVIHLFAQRTQSEARCSNVYFDGNSCYSYGRHYELGRFVTNKKGELAILIEDKGYSVTTAKHICEMRWATSQYRQFFCEEVREDRVISFIEDMVKKLQTARKKELYLNPALTRYQKFMEGVAWFGDKVENIEKLNALMDVINGGDYTEYLKANTARIKKAVQRKAREAKAKGKIELKEFYDYERNRVYYGVESYVRLSQDGESVETSQCVRVSRKEAKVLYNLIIAKKDIKGFIIGGYTVISINGVLKVGCHNINIDSMHRTGILL